MNTKELSKYEELRNQSRMLAEYGLRITDDIKKYCDSSKITSKENEEMKRKLSAIKRDMGNGGI